MFKIGNRYAVHAYKHDGRLYRSWEKPYLIYQDDQVMVLYNKFVRVFDYEARPRFSKDDTFWIFYKNVWANVQATVREGNEISYYINVASPYIVEDDTVKYIDYDLDFKVNAAGKWREVDFYEYATNSAKMQYPPEIKEAVACVERAIVAALRQKRNIVDHDRFLQWFDQAIKPARGLFINHRSGVVVDGKALVEAVNRQFLNLRPESPPPGGLLAEPGQKAGSGHG